MIRETMVQSEVESYQRFRLSYLIPPCLTLSIIRYRSRVKWSNPGKEVAPFPTPRWKGNLRIRLTNLQLNLWIKCLGEIYKKKVLLSVAHWRIVIFWEEDWFLPKPFWYLLRIFSVSGRIALTFKALYTLVLTAYQPLWVI